MTKTPLLVAIVTAALAANAEAGGSPNSIGVGAEAELSGLGGASVNYDAGDFHVGGFIGYAHFDVGAGMGGPTTSENLFELGGRFYYHIASSATADFGLGGAIDFASVPNGNSRNTYVFLEPGFQIRAFIATNVAISFTGGLAFGVADASGVTISGQTFGGNGITVGGTTIGVVGGAGVHYYFF